jgi:LPP20 lipoprotein
MKKLLSITLLCLIAATIWGCASSGPKDPGSIVEEELKGAPDWVLEGRGDDDDRIYGLGSVAGTRNVALARTSAQGRGRTEIARSLQLKVESMLKDYQATTTGGEYFGKHAADEQHIEDVSRQITDLTLNGTRQENYWVSDPGTLYVLMSLDIESFRETINSMGELDEEIRSAVNERADEAFRELNEALR